MGAKDREGPGKNDPGIRAGVRKSQRAGNLAGSGGLGAARPGRLGLAGTAVLRYVVPVNHQ